jgi:hypothetical protein
MERSLLGLLVVVVLLLVVMPVLLYLLGWAVKRYIERPPAWIGVPIPRQKLRDKPDGKALTRVKA